MKSPSRTAVQKTKVSFQCSLIFIIVGFEPVTQAGHGFYYSRKRLGFLWFLHDGYCRLGRVAVQNSRHRLVGAVPGSIEIGKEQSLIHITVKIWSGKRVASERTYKRTAKAFKYNKENIRPRIV